MKKSLYIILIGTFLSMVSLNLSAQSNKNIVGEWKYEVPSAPQEYQKGSLIISEKENQLTGKVKFSENYQLDMRDVKFEKNELTFAIYVEGSYVKVNATLNDKKELDGKAFTQEGEMKITAKKA